MVNNAKHIIIEMETKTYQKKQIPIKRNNMPFILTTHPIQLINNKHSYLDENPTTKKARSKPSLETKVETVSNVS